MRELRITSAHIDHQEIRDLYESAYPDNERIPWEDLMRLIDQMSLAFTAVITLLASPSSIPDPLSTGTGTLQFVKN